MEMRDTTAAASGQESGVTAGSTHQQGQQQQQQQQQQQPGQVVSSYPQGQPHAVAASPAAPAGMSVYYATNLPMTAGAVYMMPSVSNPSQNATGTPPIQAQAYQQIQHTSAIHSAAAYYTAMPPVSAQPHQQTVRTQQQQQQQQQQHSYQVAPQSPSLPGVNQSFSGTSDAGVQQWVNLAHSPIMQQAQLMHAYGSPIGSPVGSPYPPASPTMIPYPYTYTAMPQGYQTVMPPAVLPSNQSQQQQQQQQQQHQYQHGSNNGESMLSSAAGPARSLSLSGHQDRHPGKHPRPHSPPPQQNTSYHGSNSSGNFNYSRAARSPQLQPAMIQQVASYDGVSGYQSTHNSSRRDSSVGMGGGSSSHHRALSSGGASPQYGSRRRSEAHPMVYDDPTRWASASRPPLSPRDAGYTSGYMSDDGFSIGSGAASPVSPTHYQVPSVYSGGTQRDGYRQYQNSQSQQQQQYQHSSYEYSSRRSRRHDDNSRESNENGNSDKRNVMVKLLPQTMVDDEFRQLVCRFGPIASASVMLDDNRLCKGHGFALYKNEQDAQNAMKQLISMGYDASISYVTHKTRLIQLQDPNSRELYVSNLPDSMTDDDVRQLAGGADIIEDMRRDPARPGVAHITYVDRGSALSMCDALKMNRLQGSAQPLKVKFADTPAQREYKMRHGIGRPSRRTHRHDGNRGTADPSDASRSHLPPPALTLPPQPQLSSIAQTAPDGQTMMPSQIMLQPQHMVIPTIGDLSMFGVQSQQQTASVDQPAARSTSPQPTADASASLGQHAIVVTGYPVQYNALYPYGLVLQPGLYPASPAAANASNHGTALYGHLPGYAVPAAQQQPSDSDKQISAAAVVESDSATPAPQSTASSGQTSSTGPTAESSPDPLVLAQAMSQHRNSDVTSLTPQLASVSLDAPTNHPSA